MSVEVRIPAMLRSHVGGERSVEVRPGMLGEVLNELAGRYPALGEQVISHEGDVHRFVNVYVNDEDVRYLAGLKTQIDEGDVVSILPAVAGGEDCGPAAMDRSAVVAPARPMC
ncbi:MAG: ubiquitin-like small modifier protein 1 [Actinomycetota bacterium]